MDIQRLRNLTTRMLHTKMDDVQADIEVLTGVTGVMSHQLPNALNALEPYLREKLQDARFWDGKYDPEHIGEVDVPQMDEVAKKEMWNRYSAMPSMLTLTATN